MDFPARLLSKNMGYCNVCLTPSRQRRCFVLFVNLEEINLLYRTGSINQKRRDSFVWKPITIGEVELPGLRIRTEIIVKEAFS